MRRRRRYVPTLDGSGLERRLPLDGTIFTPPAPGPSMETTGPADRPADPAAAGWTAQVALAVANAAVSAVGY